MNQSSMAANHVLIEIICKWPEPADLGWEKPKCGLSLDI